MVSFLKKNRKFFLFYFIFVLFCCQVKLRQNVSMATRYQLFPVPLLHFLFQMIIVCVNQKYVFAPCCRHSLILVDFLICKIHKRLYINTPTPILHLCDVAGLFIFDVPVNIWRYCLNVLAIAPFLKSNLLK